MSGNGTTDVIEIIFNGGSGFKARAKPNASECAFSRNESFGCKSVSAVSCSPFPCVQAYYATVENGNPTEQLVSN